MNRLFIALFSILLSTMSFASGLTDLRAGEILAEAESVFGVKVKVFGNEKEYEALEILNDVFSADFFNSHSIPKSGKKFYLACDTYKVQVLVGTEWGDCVTYSLSSRGEIEYLPARSNALRFGAAIAATSSIDVVKIKGLNDDIRDVNALYFNANSGLAVIGGVQQNWVQLGTNFTGEVFNTDSITGGMYNVINVDFKKVSIESYHERNYIKLSSEIMQQFD